MGSIPFIMFPCGLYSLKQFNRANNRDRRWWCTVTPCLHGAVTFLPELWTSAEQIIPLGSKIRDRDRQSGEAHGYSGSVQCVMQRDLSVKKKRRKNLLCVQFCNWQICFSVMFIYKPHSAKSLNFLGLPKKGEILCVPFCNGT